MKEIKIEELTFNPFDLLKDWALVTSKNHDEFNSMTISWGGFGSLWNKYTATMYIRPQRYTKKLLDNNDYYTICFFDKEYKKELSYLGTISGNDDKNKMSNTKLTPVIEEEIVYYKEAKLVFICKKEYVNQLTKDGIIDKKVIEQNYQNNDYSYEYIGKIEKVLIKKTKTQKNSSRKSSLTVFLCTSKARKRKTLPKIKKSIIIKKKKQMKKEVNYGSEN